MRMLAANGKTDGAVTTLMRRTLGHMSWTAHNHLSLVRCSCRLQIVRIGKMRSLSYVFATSIERPAIRVSSGIS